MFEDIIGDLKKRRNYAKGGDVCPFCGSEEITDTYGTFVGGNCYAQSMTCLICESEWVLTLDSDLNIIDIQCGFKLRKRGHYDNYQPPRLGSI